MNAIQTLLTDHLDIWTAADTEKKSGRGRSSGNADRVYGIRKLRELILELAVRGKLVPQDPNDEPASVLLDRIAKEKARLIKEGRIAKKESLPRLSEEEKRFDLPNGWVWARFGGIFELEYGNNLPEAKRTSTGEYPVFGSNGVVGSHNSHCIDKPCIVVGRKGSAGALNLCLNDKCWVTDVAYSVIPPTALDLKFVFKLFHTLGLDSLGKGIKPGLNRNEAYVLPIAIPPLKEQHRIVAKVDELMALCDQLEQQQTGSIAAHQTLVEALLGTLTCVESQQEFSAAWARIASHFDTLFTSEASIDQLKQTILQLAVMGKLVHQDPNDEPAAKLLERIDRAPKRVMRSRETGDEDSDAQSEVNSLFELPDAWEWTTFGRLPLRAFVGIDRGRTQQGSDKAYAYFKMNNIRNSGGVDLSDLTRIDATSDEVETFALDDGDFLFNTRNSRELVGKSCVFRSISDDPVLYNNNILRAKFIDGFAPDFLDYWFRSQTGRAELDKLKSNTTNVCAIYQGKLATLPCVVPPLSEQHRIVAKVDELMALCDTLKARLADAQAIQTHLADAIVEQAVY